MMGFRCFRVLRVQGLGMFSLRFAGFGFKGVWGLLGEVETSS